jgi:hypothetical protein
LQQRGNLNCGTFPSLLSVMVALLGAEWFIRKRSGML